MLFLSKFITNNRDESGKICIEYKIPQNQTAAKANLRLLS